jgi:predicted porin
MTSLKKLIAVLAISLPLAALAQQAAAPAAATPPLAQIYGTLNANIENIGAPGAPTIPQDIQSRWAVSLDSANLGVKGTAAVAGGLSVVYQCETSANLDGISASGICNRNSRVGLTHATYGTIFLGNWDTPFKAAYYGTKADDPFWSTGVYGANNIMGSPGYSAVATVTNSFTASTNTPAPTVASFDLRAPNSIAYWTPKIQGVSAKFQWSVNEFSTFRLFGGTPSTQQPFTTTTGANNQQLAPQVLSAVVNYDQGPLSVLVSYEQHRDMQGIKAFNFYRDSATSGAAGGVTIPQQTINFASRDEGWRVGAGYEIPLPIGPLTVAAVWEQLKYTSRNEAPISARGAASVGNNGVSEYKRPAWSFSAKQRYGDHEIRGRFNWADKGSCEINNGADCAANVAGKDVHEVTLGYSYYLAASTQVYAFFTKIMNGQQAQYTPIAGGTTSGSPAVVAPGQTVFPAGADPEAVGVGIKYAF